jgi:hypothetical protein
MRSGREQGKSAIQFWLGMALVCAVVASFVWLIWPEFFQT